MFPLTLGFDFNGTWPTFTGSISDSFACALTTGELDGRKFPPPAAFVDLIFTRLNVYGYGPYTSFPPAPGVQFSLSTGVKALFVMQYQNPLAFSSTTAAFEKVLDVNPDAYVDCNADVTGAVLIHHQDYGSPQFDATSGTIAYS